mmetsp:Transcript_19467/g.63447  ORF Transcript_19467/g.63447 Transcript_19467/m.63447 type:complete len:257 (-) Transcript_19467:3642-4412(-)
MGDVDLVEWRVQDGEAAAGRYVLGAADGELVGEIMANTARLYHEEEGGKGADGLEGLADGRTQPFVDQKGEEARQQIEGEEQERYRVEEPVEERERRRSHARNDAGGVDQTADEGEREHQIAGVVVVQLAGVIANVGVVEAEQPAEREPLPEAECLARCRHLGSALRQFREKLQNGDGAHVTAFANLEVFAMHDVVAAQLRVHASKDIFREVEPLGRLGESALRHEHELVHDVRVAVVVTAPERPRERSLDESAKD